MSECTFRKPRPDDEPRLAELMRALDAGGAGIRPISEATIRRTLAYLRTADDRALCVVAADGAGEIIGYAMLFSFWSCEYGGELLLLDELYVVPERRSRGVGARLMKWIEDHAATTGRVGVTFGVRAHNERAMAFYSREGYNRLDLVTFDKLIPGAEGSA